MQHESIRVDLRTITLSEAASLQPADASVVADASVAADALFLVLDRPPPVGTVLALRSPEDAVSWGFEVRRVIEGGEGPRGCIGVRVDGARLADADFVGSEHLDPLPPLPAEDEAEGEEKTSPAAGPTLAIVEGVVDDEPIVTHIPPPGGDIPLAAGGGKLRKGRTRV